MVEHLAGAGPAPGIGGSCIAPGLSILHVYKAHFFDFFDSIRNFYLFTILSMFAAGGSTPLLNMLWMSRMRSLTEEECSVRRRDRDRRRWEIRGSNKKE